MGQIWLSDACTETVLKTPTPTTAKGVREFLGTAGFCCLWIPGCAELAKPLYEATKEGREFTWTEENSRFSKPLSRNSWKPQPLGYRPSPNLYLFVDQGTGIARGVLTGTLEMASSLPVRKTRSCGSRAVPVPKHYSVSCPPGQGCC